MKEYGTEKTEHIGICDDCNENKMLRLFLTTDKEEVNVCIDCYIKGR